MSDDKTPTEKLVEYTDIYAAGRAPGANQNHKNDELEVRLGVIRPRNASRIVAHIRNQMRVHVAIFFSSLDIRAKKLQN